MFAEAAAEYASGGAEKGSSFGNDVAGGAENGGASVVGMD